MQFQFSFEVRAQSRIQDTEYRWMNEVSVKWVESWNIEKGGKWLI